MPFCVQCNKYNYLLCDHPMQILSEKMERVFDTELKYYCRYCMNEFRYYEEMRLHLRRENH